MLPRRYNQLHWFLVWQYQAELAGFNSLVLVVQAIITADHMTIFSSPINILCLQMLDLNYYQCCYQISFLGEGGVQGGFARSFCPRTTWISARLPKQS